MPLIILGLLAAIGIVIYALIRYGQSDDVDTRTVRERYPHVFEKVEQTVDHMKKGVNYTIIDDDEDNVSEDRAEYQDIKSEYRTGKAELRTDKAEHRTDKAEHQNNKAAYRTDKTEYEDDNAKYRAEDGHTLHFPDDAEVEKRKRNIH